MLKAALLSDIHIDMYVLWDEFCDLISDHVVDNEVQVLIICGDVANGLKSIDFFFRKLATSLEKSNCEILFVPGNHDLWVDVLNSPNPPSNEKYYNTLPKMLSKYDNVTYLPQKPYVYGNKAVVGSMGWYDFSFVKELPNIPIDNVDNVLQDKWVDKKNMYWNGMLSSDTNEVILKETLTQLKDDLDKFKDKAEVTVCTHMVPQARFCRRMKEFDLSSAYMGSNKINSLIQGYGNVKNVFFGHTHYVVDEIYEGKKYVNASIGLKHQNKGKHVSKYLIERMRLIEI